MKVVCLIQDVVSPHYGGKRMARRCTRSYPGKIHLRMQRKQSE